MEPPPSCPSSPLSPVPSLSSSPLSSLLESALRPELADPAGRYPSPMSTTASGAQPSPTLAATAVPGDVDVLGLGAQREQPTTTTTTTTTTTLGAGARRRRTARQPRSRRTERLDLTKPNSDLTAQDHAQMDRLATLLRKKKKIVVIAGAGISVSAGIPDFRSANGLFARAKNQHNLRGSGTQLFDASVYRHDASTESFHAMVREMADLSRRAAPTPFHHLLASLSQEGRLLRLYSQNIDCLDTGMAPLETRVPLPARAPWPTTVQLHGGLHKMVCSKCHLVQPFEAALFRGPEPPLCDACRVDDEVRTAHAGKRSHGIGRLRPRFVLYNEFNPDGEAIGNVSAADLKARPDAVLVVGTTLKVPGTRRLAKEMCQVARGRRDGLTVWINLDPEPKAVELRDCWDLVVRAKCDDVARLAALPPWDCDIGSDYLVSKDHDDDDDDDANYGKATFEISIPSSPVKPKRKPAGSSDELTAPGSPTPVAKTWTKGRADRSSFKSSLKTKKAPTKKPRQTTAPAPATATATTTTTKKKKQTKISFAADAEAAQRAAPAEPVKKPARRPRQPAKRSRAASAKAAAIQDFASVTKNVSADAAKLLDAPALAPLSRKRLREEVSPPGGGEQESGSGTSRKRQMMETISPKTVPRGLRQFID